ncbi:hypothetical protein CHS0354_004503 [Potamilus streckersoni]|uniref:N-acetyltransferase domain-containing protein n=1 Tax=Potamilus streckersoni TaxID=2493646 RepID=A0AAE0VQS8_9BIVA|nr:hypothetical protein CHS0354_004503 [Potamilus streckersoni]
MDLVTIRDATNNDCDQIMGLVQELAEFEKLSDQVKINGDVLRRDGFGNEQFFRCKVAEVTGAGNSEGGKLVAYGLYFFTYSTFEGRMVYLEDLYVTPSWRGKGIGTKIWKDIAKIAVEKDCQRMQWTVLNWNQSAIELYKNRGAVDLTLAEKWHIFRMRRRELEAFANA